MSQTFSAILCGSLLIYMVFTLRFIFLSFKAHHDLVRFEYENLHEQLEKDGEPDGMLFWRAPARSNNLINRLLWSNPGLNLFVRLFITPKWVNEYPQAQKYLKTMRMNALWWNVGIGALMILFFVVINIVRIQS